MLVTNMMQNFGIYISQITYADVRNTQYTWNTLGIRISFSKAPDSFFQSLTLWLHNQLKVIMLWSAHERCDVAHGTASPAARSQPFSCVGCGAGVAIELKYSWCQLFLLDIVIILPSCSRFSCSCECTGAGARRENKIVLLKGSII